FQFPLHILTPLFMISMPWTAQILLLDQQEVPPVEYGTITRETATEPTDHSIERDLMHVIWAQGQEPNKYVHSPKSGLEQDFASVKDFYRQDELKYHGHKDQRGKTTLNFF
ncbi:unnamed protein product, partial [Timema podura]|nr:unnamed protein product [Timema podura]